MQGLLLNAASADSSPTHWGVVAIGLLTLIYIAFVRPMRNRKRKDPLNDAGSKTLLAQQRSVERDMAALLVDYEQMIRQMTAQVETRVAKLEILLKEADTKLEALRVESRRLPAGAASSETKLTERDAATSVHSAATAVVVEVPVVHAEPPEPPGEHDELYRLADAGLDAATIARDTGQLEGEIALILKLRPDREHRSGKADVQDIDVPDDNRSPIQASHSESDFEPMLAGAAAAVGGGSDADRRHGKRRKHRR